MDGQRTHTILILRLECFVENDVSSCEFVTFRIKVVEAVHVLLAKINYERNLYRNPQYKSNLLNRYYVSLLALGSFALVRTKAVFCLFNNQKILPH